MSRPCAVDSQASSAGPAGSRRGSRSASPAARRGRGPRERRHAGRAGHGVLHLPEDHPARRGQHPVRDVAVGARRQRPRGQPVQGRDPAGAQVPDPVDGPEEAVGEQLVLDVGPQPRQRLGPRRRAVVALGQHPVGVREPVGLEVVGGRHQVVEAVDHGRPRASAARPRRSMKAARRRKVTAVTTPRAPRPDPCGREQLRLGRCRPAGRAPRCRRRGPGRVRPPARTATRAGHRCRGCRSRSRRRPSAGRCRPGCAAPGPSPSSTSSSACSGVPASTVTVIASRSTAVTPVSRWGSSSSPSVAAMSVNEWPDPTIFTRSPWARAATTASRTSPASPGAIVCVGRTVVRPDQLCHMGVDSRTAWAYSDRGHSSGVEPARRPPHVHRGPALRAGRRARGAASPGPDPRRRGTPLVRGGRGDPAGPR